MDDLPQLSSIFKAIDHFQHINDFWIVGSDIVFSSQFHQTTADQNNSPK